MSNSGDYTQAGYEQWMVSRGYAIGTAKGYYRGLRMLLRRAGTDDVPKLLATIDTFDDPADRSLVRAGLRSWGEYTDNWEVVLALGKTRRPMPLRMSVPRPRKRRTPSPTSGKRATSSRRSASRPRATTSRATTAGSTRTPRLAVPDDRPPITSRLAASKAVYATPDFIQAFGEWITTDKGKTPGTAAHHKKSLKRLAQRAKKRSEGDMLRALDTYVRPTTLNKRRRALRYWAHFLDDTTTKAILGDLRPPRPRGGGRKR